MIITITIPKNISKDKELVAVPKKEYEEFSVWQRSIKKYKTFTPTEAQKRELKRAREDYKKGRYLTINELKQKLGIKQELKAWEKASDEDFAKFENNI